MGKIDLFSFFSGAGLLDMGFVMNGFKTCFVNEMYKPFLEAYKYSREIMGIEEPEYGYFASDISDYLKGKQLMFLKELIAQRKKEGIVGFIGGPPCPDFSIGGKNRGREGDNGKLSGIYMELITQCRPDFFLFENVKGLWRTQKHREFYEELKRKVQKNNYITAERLINAIEYGAPQDRDRIILVGFSKDLINRLKIKLNNKNCLSDEQFPWKHAILYNKNEIFSLPWPKTEPFRANSNLPCPEEIKKELTVEYWFEKNKVQSHPNARHCFTPRAGITRFKQVAEGDDSKKSFKRLHRWRYAPTVCFGNNEVHLHPYKIRRINAAEALSLQSVPAKFCFPDDMTLTDMFKTIGNGVPFMAAKALAKSIEKFLEGINENNS